ARTKGRGNAALCVAGVAFGWIGFGQNQHATRGRERHGCPQPGDPAADDHVVIDVCRTEGQSVDVILVAWEFQSSDFRVQIAGRNSDFTIGHVLSSQFSVLILKSEVRNLNSHCHSLWSPSASTSRRRPVSTPSRSRMECSIGSHTYSTKPSCRHGGLSSRV